MTAGTAQLLALALPGLTVGAGQGGGGLWLGSGSDAPPFSLRSAAGKPCLWHAERTAEIAADMDSADPLLSRVEQASGWRFEPREVLAEAPARTLLISDGDSAIEIGLNPAAAPPPALVAAAAAAPREPSLAVERRLVLRVGGVNVDEAASLAPGDLLIVPDCANATLGDVAASLDLASGRLSASRWSEPAGSFALSVEVELPKVSLSDEAMDRLSQGEELPLGLLPEGLGVTLGAGGHSLGTGTLIRFGQRLAVRIDQSEGRASE